MNFYIDTEFHEYELNNTDTIELLSIGIEDENGREYYAVCNEFDTDNAWNNTWLRDNVIPSLFAQTNPQTLEEFNTAVQTYGKSKALMSEEIKTFIYNKTGENPDGYTDINFYGYYCDHDWVVFCWLFGRMIDLPEHFPMYCKDLKQLLDYTSNLLKVDILTHLDMVDISTSYDFNDNAFITSFNTYPQLNNEHNALNDAKWNRQLHNFIIDIKSKLS